MFSFLIFWLTTFILGLAVLPVTGKLFSSFYDRGYVFTKTLGILIISYLLWIMATFGILDNSRGSIFLILIAASAASWFFTYKDTLRFLKQRLNYIFLVEVIFFVVLAIFSLLRAANPELSGGEKPTDLSLINSIFRSIHFPPQDAWLAGFPINYYYFGHLIIATLAKLSGLPVEITFNLGVALVFTLAFLGVFGLVFDLIFSTDEKQSLKKPLIFGLLAALAMSFGGNFEVLAEFLNSWGWGLPQFWQSLNIPGLPNFPNNPQFFPHEIRWWFRASRLMPDAVTEFPYFSALFGDLHAHVLALPLSVAALGLAWQTLRSWRQKIENFRQWLRLLPTFLLTSLLLGSLGFANTWDFPIYLALWGTALTLGKFMLYRRANWAFLKDTTLSVTTILGLSAILYFPYYFGERISNVGLQFVLAGPRVSLHHFLGQFGLFIVLVIGFLTFLSLRLKRLTDLPLLLFLLIGPLILLKLWLFALLAGLFLTASYLVLKLAKRATKPFDESILFVLILILFASLLAFASETIYIWGRRDNTIFKLYYPLWLILATSAGFGGFYLWQKKSFPVLRRIIMIPAILLFLASFIYPALATPQKLKESTTSPQLTLNGLAFLEKNRPQEYQALKWLQTNITGSPIVLEAPGRIWSSGSPVSSYTGLPTLVGWIEAEKIWRGKGLNYDFPQLGERLKDITIIYGSGDDQLTISLLKKYSIRYVYVGPLEREKYGQSAQKFSRLLKPVFQNEAVVIFENRD